MASNNVTHPSTHSVHVAKENLQTLLVKNLRLPPYQRRYCWGKQQVTQLIEDIDKLLYALSGNNVNQPVIPLFLGTIILHQQTNCSEKEIEFDLVDGQQRCLTLCLLVMAIKENDNSSAIIDELLSHKGLNLLKATFTNREAQQQLASNFALIKSIISTKEWGTNKLQLTYLMEQCEFVVITINSVDQAFAFFDSQNSAGKRLSEFDLLKARHLRGVVSDSSVGIGCSRIWEEYENLKLNSCYSQHVAYYLTEQLIGRARQRQRGKRVDKLQLASEFSVLTQKPFDSQRGKIPASVQLGVQSNSQLYQNWQVHYHPDKRNTFPFTFSTELQLGGGNKLLYSLDKVSELPLQLNQPLIGGEQFFIFIAKYAELYKQLFVSDIAQQNEPKDQIEGNKPIQERLLSLHREQEYKQGRGYPRLIQSWQALVLFYVDRFGQDENFNEFVQLSDQYIFSLRILLVQLRRASIENKLLGEALFARLLQLPTSKQTVDFILQLIDQSASELELLKQTKGEIKGVRKKYMDSFYWNKDEKMISHKKSPNRLSTLLIEIKDSTMEAVSA